MDNVKFVDHSKEFEDEMSAAILLALTRMGLKADGYAKDYLTEQKAVDTGLLRNSVTFKVDPANDTVYIGTNVEYAPYIELGTGAKNTPGGRPGSWGYIDDEGRAHHTSGQKARPYLKPAVANHKQTYRNILKDELENG